MTGPRELGSRCRRTMWRSPAPVALAARTYSRSLRERIWPRTRRAMVGQDASPMARSLSDDT